MGFITPSSEVRSLPLNVTMDFHMFRLTYDRDRLIGNTAESAHCLTAKLSGQHKSSELLSSWYYLRTPERQIELLDERDTTALLESKRNQIVKAA